jgi:PAS domain S-box-containing protein
MATDNYDSEDKRLRSVLLQTANTILQARQRAEQELIQAKEALERKSEELAHSLAMMRATLEATSNGILVTDASRNVTHFNQNYIEMWRLPREMMARAGHNQLVEIISPQLKEPERFRARIEEIYLQSPSESFDVLELADGRVFERFTTFQFVERRVVGRVWSFRDITERIRAEQELRQQREWFQVTLSSIGDAVITTDTAGNISFLNPVAELMTGWKSETAAGQPLEKVFRIINEETRAAATNPIPRVLREAANVGLANQTALVSKDGREMSIEDSAAPIRDATGHVSGAVMVFHDVTERRRAERALKEADRRKDEFIATLAHELRNPLTPISNGLEILKRAGNDPTTAENARAMMDQALNQMVRLVDDLLDISRITTGKLQLRKERVELATVVQTVLNTSRMLIEEQGHKLTVNLPSAPVLLDADPTRLAQVFANLLNNAVKFSEPGGAITMSAELAGDQAIVRVRDKGIGIPADHLERIFEVFAQVDLAFERQHGGLGIGLSLARGLVEMHGGGIEAHSAGPGMGSEFIVRLPVAVTRQLAAASNAAAAEVYAGPKYRILVVDDNSLASKTTAMVLRMEGHEVGTARDGIEGLECAQQLRPDVILLDLGLPQLNGLEIARRIREQPWGKEIFLLAVTGYGQEADRRRSLEAGFDYHMVKPINFTDLKKLLSDRWRMTRRAGNLEGERMP